MEGIDLRDVLPILNLAWFDRCDDGTFLFCGRAPEWLISLYPEATAPDTRLQLGDKSLFLSHFLEDAAEFWEGAWSLTPPGTVAVLEWLMREHGAEINSTDRINFYVDCDVCIGRADTLSAATLAAALEVVKDE